VAWCHSPNHPDLATPAGDERTARYNIDSTWPSAFFDGPHRAPLTGDRFYEVYDSMVKHARSLTTVLELSLDSATTRLDSTELSIGVHITPTDSAVDLMTDLALVAVIYEDSAPYEYWSGATHYIRFCAREVIGGTWGIPLTLRLGADYDTVLAAPLGAWDRSHLGVAVFVQDTSSLRVLQAIGKRRFAD
jgi:hypothetical protein